MAMHRILIYVGMSVVFCTVGCYRPTIDADLLTVAKSILLFEQNTGEDIASVNIRDKKPMHSWRVMVSPYVEVNSFYNQYDLRTSWNEGGNLNLISNDSIQVKQNFCAITSDPNKTKIVLIVPDSAQASDYRGRLLRPTEGWAIQPSRFNNELLVVAKLRTTDIHWMQPLDLAISEILASQDLTSSIESIYVHSRRQNVWQHKSGDSQVLDFLQSLR